ncbi:MAG: energy-coupled thiamine transporter ThiT [Clostridia bacterium]|nr:energy-coupled thiamine transporter ThiT [Clostridia bacterium]
MFHFSLLSSFLSKTDDGYVYKDVWTEYAKDLLSAVFMYTAIALAVILIAIGIFVKLKKPDSFGAFFKIAATIAITFAFTVIIAMLAIGFAKISEKGYAQRENGLLELVPPLVLGGVIVLGIIATYIAHFFTPKAFKITLITSLSAIGAALVATIVCLIVYFSKSVAGDGWYGEQINQLALYLTAGGLIIAIVAIAVLTDMKNKTRFDSRCIALAGICIALSFALSYIKMFSLPQGGSVTLASLLPVMLFAYIYGPKKGLFVGCVYGALQAMQNPWLIHPAQFLLDYPVAFGAVGLAGAFNKIKQLDKFPQIKFALGAAVAGIMRFAAHVFSGVFAFGADAGGQNLWAYSTAYNSFVFVDVAIVIAVGVIILSSKSFAKRITLYANTKKSSAENTEEEN